MAKVITLGEIMLRLSTEYGKLISNSQSLAITFGGGEANVAASLANFNHQVKFASKVPNNKLGKSVEKFLKSFEIETDQLLFDGNRLGTYYLETGVGNRSPSVVYDRKFSSFSEMNRLEWHEDIFQNVNLFHISGITPGLSKEWERLTLELILLAKDAGCKVSFDINFRSKIWNKNQFKEFLKKVLPLIDYCSASKLDAIHFFDVPNFDQAVNRTDSEMSYYYENIQKKYPNLSVLYSTTRLVESSNKHFLTGTMWMDQQISESKTYCIDPVVDRVGAGDAFSAGILHGLLADFTPSETIDFATAASVLKHSIFGDFNQFSADDILTMSQTETNGIIR